MRYFIILLIVLSAGCGPRLEFVNMPLPPHLYKPFDSIEFRSFTTSSVSPGETNNFKSITPNQGIIIVIKDFENTDTVDELWFEYYKNNSLLFKHGKSTTLISQSVTRPAHTFEYIRDNPIIIRSTDILRIKVWNNSGVLQTVYAQVLGYSYAERRQEMFDKEESVRGKSNSRIVAN